MFCASRNFLDGEGRKGAGDVDRLGFRGARGGSDFAIFVVKALVGGRSEEKRVRHFFAKQRQRCVEATDVAQDPRLEQKGIVNRAIAAQRNFVGGATLQVFAGK